MKKHILYSLKSPYRESLDVVGISFGGQEKSACVVGSLRGDEVQQMYICTQLIGELSRLEKKGLINSEKGIMVIPCVNYYSMNIGKRFWAMDNTDINRMFPGYDQGETTQRIADGVFTKLQGYEYGIQLCSFYQSGNFLPHVKFMETGFNDKELMKYFGFRYGIVRKPKPYDTTTLNYNWQIWETKAFSIFAGTTYAIDEKSCRQAVRGILRFLNATGIISYNTVVGYNTQLVNEQDVYQIRTKTSGIFCSKVKAGDIVEEGDILAEIIDGIDGSITSQIKSGKDGLVYFEYDKPIVNANTVCYKIISTK